MCGGGGGGGISLWLTPLIVCDKHVGKQVVLFVKRISD